MVNTTYVLCFEPILWHAFLRNPEGVKIMPEEPKGKICDSDSEGKRVWDRTVRRTFDQQATLRNKRRLKVAFALFHCVTLAP